MWTFLQVRGQKQSKWASPQDCYRFGIVWNVNHPRNEEDLPSEGVADALGVNAGFEALVRGGVTYSDSIKLSVLVLVRRRTNGCPAWGTSPTSFFFGAFAACHYCDDGPRILEDFKAQIQTGLGYCTLLHKKVPIMLAPVVVKKRYCTLILDFQSIFNKKQLETMKVVTSFKFI